MERNRERRYLPKETVQPPQGLRRIMEDGLREKHGKDPIIDFIDPYSFSLSGPDLRANREAITIQRTYNWLNLMFGTIRDERLDAGLTNYLDLVWGGISRTLTPREEKGDSTKSIKKMQERYDRLQSRFRRQQQDMSPQDELSIRADLLGSSIALKLTKHTLEEFEIKTGDSHRQRRRLKI